MVRILLRRWNGRDKSPLAWEPADIGRAADGGELIGALVRAELAGWRPAVEEASEDLAAEAGFSGPLSAAEIKTAADGGRINFGRKHSWGLPPEDEAAEAARAAFSNGLVRLFINDEPVKNLEQALTLQDDDRVTLIALTGLGGVRTWAGRR